MALHGVWPVKWVTPSTYSFVEPRDLAECRIRIFAGRALGDVEFRDARENGGDVARFKLRGDACSTFAIGVATNHTWPNGSWMPPHRSPQSLSPSGSTIFEPAAVARPMTASTSSTYRYSGNDVIPPSAVGDFCELRSARSLVVASRSMKFVCPIAIWTWLTFPSGCANPMKLRCAEHVAIEFGADAAPSIYMNGMTAP